MYDHVELTLSTLAALTAIKSDLKLDGGQDQGVRIKKILYSVAFRGKTAAEGPLWYGLCAKDVSLAELAETLLADPQSDRDVPASEQVDRRVVMLGSIGSSDGNRDGPGTLQRGKWFWLVREHEGIQFWVFNRDGGALTTGATVEWSSFISGEWQND